MKTLAFILHFNSTQYTDVLYRQLKKYERDDYDLYVIDNGSDKGKKSQYAYLELEKNIYYGGGLNVAFDYFIKNQSSYDSLLFLNSDLIVNGYYFIKQLRHELFNNDLKILSPSIIQPEEKQCYWRQMHHWCSGKTRIVKWVDFQCPVFHKDFILHQKRYDDILIYGWGQDLYSGMICGRNNWKIGVSDLVTAIHLNSKTIQENQHIKEIKNYNYYAEKNMNQFFKREKLTEEFLQYKNWGRDYQYEIDR